MNVVNCQDNNAAIFMNNFITLHITIEHDHTLYLLSSALHYFVLATEFEPKIYIYKYTIFFTRTSR